MLPLSDMDVVVLSLSKELLLISASACESAAV